MDSRSIEVGFFSIDSRHLLDWLRYPCMHFLFLCFAFFFFVSIAPCFSFSCRSMVPCSPHSLYISFLSVFGQVFWHFMPFDNRVKKAENFENWMSFLRGSNRLKGRVSLIHFDIDIYFVLCIFWFCKLLHTSCVVSIFDDDVCVSLFNSHVISFLSLYTCFLFI